MVHREPPEGLALHPTASSTLEETSENKELVLAFKRGEDGAYQAIYDRYSTRVSGICRRMLEQSHDAEEAQQETFMRVYTSLPNFNGRYQLGAWVSRIATNVCLDHIRSRGRKPADSTDQTTLVDISDDSAKGPEELFMQGDERQRVREVLTGLAPMHRAALALREFEGMSYSDIAVALNMTEPQVKALIHRARRSFKQKWAHGLALLLPWRLLARLRRFSHHYDAPPQLADAAASTSTFASSCSAALQQCGAILTDKAAGAFTALVVGTAAVGVAVAPGGVVKHHAVTVAPASDRESSKDQPPEDTKSERKHQKKRSEPRLAPAVAPAPGPTPAAEPTPVASPTTPPPSDGGSQPGQEKEGSGTDMGTGKPPATPAPPPLYTYFGWDRGQPIPRATAVSQTTELDCDARSLNHRVDTRVSDGSFSYRAVVDVDVTGGSARLEMRVWTGDGEVLYSSWGPEPVATWFREGDRARLEITGDYGARHGYDPNAAKLPTSGRFNATLTLDCAALSVITEGAGFTAE